MSKGPWPTPAYAARRALKASRADARARIAAHYFAPTVIVPPTEHRTPNAAQRLIAGWYVAGELTRAVQDRAKRQRMLDKIRKEQQRKELRTARAA